MGEIKYLLIEPDEDVAPNSFMTEEELRKYLNSKYEGIQNLRFLDEKGIRELGNDQNYWKDHIRCLLKIEFLQPKPKQIKTEWVI